MRLSRLPGCPRPQNITLQTRLTQIIGGPVRIRVPGQTISGTLTAVENSAVVVNNLRVGFENPFAIDQGFFETESVPIKVSVTVRGIGRFEGDLVRVGLDFIEFEQDLPEDIARWIIPLNTFVRARCNEEEEE